MVRVGFLSVAHMHAYGYARALNDHPEVALAGVWDHEPDRAKKFALDCNSDFISDAQNLLATCDAVVICSENKFHAEHIEWAAKKGVVILCEKPLVTSEEEASRVRAALANSKSKLITSFPCRYSPAFQRLKQRVNAGDIGRILAVCATNHGTCPFDWFVQPEVSGGGAMIDHTVHVADLLWDLMKSEPIEAYAQTGNRIYGKRWEDTAMLHVKFANGVFATIDASWSRPKSYKTWGDVKMNVVGEKGVIELDMFSQAMDIYTENHSLAGFGSDMDKMLIADFVRCIKGEIEPPITAEDGLRASKIATAAYASAAANEAVAIPVLY